MRDFFEHQHRARRKTLWLVVLFGVAVAAIVFLTYLVVAGVVVTFDAYRSAQPVPGAADVPSFWQPMVLVAVTPCVLLLVVGASLYRLSQLQGGGKVVASSLGGRVINGDTTDTDERKVLNVVEEMAIASGVPVPPVYVMDREHGINAFAAGYKPEDAVVGVTRGCIEQLSRDELQGVIAHEFSHILNGDMRLNLRLVGVLFGILVIGLIGQGVLRGMMYTPRVSVGVGSRNKKGGWGVLVIVVAAIALLIIGYVGVFIGNLIKAAISRQREYLADASAVQFTRNPEGIAGALKKIGGLSFGSRLRAGGADEFSHLFFGEGVAHHLGSLGATHPPLKDRICRIDPGWEGGYPKVEPTPEVQQRVRDNQEKLSRSLDQRSGLASGLGAGVGLAAASLATRAARSAVQDVGNPSEAHVALARELLAGMPGALRDAAREPYSARAVVFALLLDDDASVAGKQLAGIEERNDATVSSLVRDLRRAVVGMDERARLPLIDLAVASLRRLTQSQFEVFVTDVNALVKEDGRINAFEWMIGGVLRRHLTPVFEKVGRVVPKYYSIHAVTDELAVVLSALAWSGTGDEEAAKRAVATAVHAAKLRKPIGLLARETCTIASIDRSLKKLAELEVAVKRHVVIACAACIAADHDISVREGELMRAVADAIGVPMPPLLPGQRLV